MGDLGHLISRTQGGMNTKLHAVTELMGWMPLRPASYDARPAYGAPEKEEQMTDVHILAIDLAKRSFQVCATAPGGGGSI